VRRPEEKQPNQTKDLAKLLALFYNKLSFEACLFAGVTHQTVNFGRNSADTSE